ncbi:hypothetical protein AgCh_001246 [Apium graveolens]
MEGEGSGYRFKKSDDFCGSDYDEIKNKLESECPGIVSYAEILTVATRDATILVGGPYWHVPLGRNDSKTAGYELATSNLPGANEGLLSMISKFMYQDLSVTDLVALSGGIQTPKEMTFWRCPF